MADISTLQALAERLEKATKPDAGLDRDLMCLAFGKPSGLLADYETRIWKADGKIVTSLRPTSSVDGALALVERLLPGAEYEITTMYGVARVSLPLNDSGFGPSYGNDETGNVPLAISRAMVAALIAEETSHG